MTSKDKISFVSLTEYRNPNFCPICLMDFQNGCIKNNKFTMPNKWNFDILNCGHVLCQNCMDIYFEKEKKCPFRCKNLKRHAFGDKENSWLTVKQGMKQWEPHWDRICRNPSSLIRGKNTIGLFNCILNNSYLIITRNKENNLLIKKKKKKLKKHFKQVLRINHQNSIIKWKRSHRKNQTLSDSQLNKIKQTVFANVTKTKKFNSFSDQNYQTFF